MSKSWDETLVREPFQSSTRSVLNGILHAVSGPHRGLKSTLYRERLHVGRADWCDLTLDRDSLVSRHHGELLPQAEGVRVRDLSSRNGIFIEGVRVFDSVLMPGQRLEIGDTRFELSLAEAKATELVIPHHDRSKRLVGSSESMRELFSLVEHIAPFELPILLLGETGTGKSSLALAIHEQSPRADEPFVHVNCGALSPSLVESELFGYEKGAFTNAQKQHRGFFEQAHGGTLFLDEIAELPLELQPKLLDVVERGRVRRLGAEREVEVDVRLITATHRDLLQEVAQARFREDLYYRIAVAELSIPPLRERREDLPLLVAHIFAQMGDAISPSITEQGLQKLAGYLWPGNVRQLRNVLERGLLFSRGEALEAAHLRLPALPLEGRKAASPSDAPRPEFFEELLREECGDDAGSLQQLLEASEKKLLEETLERYYWNARKVQEHLGISRSWYYTLLKRHGLRRPQ